MDGPGHGPRAWSDAQTSVCPLCGSPVPASADRCPQCNRPYAADDAATILGDLPTPLPVPAGNASDDVTRFATADDDVTRFVAPDEDATRFVAPATERDDVTHIVSPDGDVTRFAAPDAEGADVTRLAPDDALTVAAPATPPTHKRPRRSGPDAGPLDVGQSFGPRYHIIRMLGVGGMGAVYQAWDAELGVAVAIKVIRPEVMEDPVMADEVSRRF